MKPKISFLVLFFSFSVIGLAQTCCSGGIPLSNNIGLSAEEKGTLQIGLNYDYNNLNRLKIGDELIDENSRLRITHSILLNLGYSITDNLSVESLLTWVNQRRNISQFGNENLDQTSGVGDGVFLIKYLFKNFLGRNSSANLGVGAKIPIGSADETNSQGITLNADLQPGSNAWDFILWSRFGKSFNFRPSLNVSMQFSYRLPGTNEEYLGNNTYKFGDELQGFLNFSDQLLVFSTLMYPTLTIKYRNMKRDEIGGFDLSNTGGSWVWLIPQFAVDIRSNLKFVSSFEIPIYGNVDGTQLSPTYRVTSGLLLRINPKPKFQPTTI